MTPERYATAAIALFATAACSETAPDPVFGAPFTDWRSTGTESRIMNLPDGRRLRLPAGDGGCGWPPDDAPLWTICTFDWSRKTGRLIPMSVGYDPHRVQMSFYFEPGVSQSLTNMARGQPDQWPQPPADIGVPNPVPVDGPVRGRLPGRVSGHAYWFGCWRYGTGYPYPYGCNGAIDLGRDGGVSIEFETAEPTGTEVYVPDRARIEAIVRTAIALRASFTEPPPGKRG